LKKSECLPTSSFGGAARRFALEVAAMPRFRG
jgi:hypothetical protein